MVILVEEKNHMHTDTVPSRRFFYFLFYFISFLFITAILAIVF